MASVGPVGLTHQEAARLLAVHGPNELQPPQVRSAWSLLIGQLSSSVMVLLLVAAVLSLLLRETADAIAIFVMIALNVVLGFTQEFRAERALESLRRLATPAVPVIREGMTHRISSRDLVPGDLLVVEAGQVAPADGELLEAVHLQVNEAALTGESLPVEKDPGGDNLLHAGTTVTYGRGMARITRTGLETAIGKIASLVAKQPRMATPLEVRLEHLGRRLALAAIALVAVLMVEGWLRGEAWRVLLLTAISMAVAAVPEGLPAAVTIALALGSQRMLKRNALIRRLSAVETLGSVTVICTDKTGTLTENRMRVAQTVADPADESLVLLAAALNNDATRGPNGWEGDPTEAALVEAAEQAGLDVATLRRDLPRIAEVPFSSERKTMTTVHRVDRWPEGIRNPLPPGAREIAIVKGAVDRLPVAAPSQDALAARGLRVLGTAWAASAEGPFRYLGMLGLEDPPRPEAKDAVAQCRAAGIRPIMLTGDHALTAANIAASLGFAADSVYARVTPEEKLKIIESLQSEEQVVAMTGDGVNDAPALQRADIGVAMGRGGTAVARDASDMILLDDNFATIVAAVREGRAIYDNLRKFVLFLISCNSGELWVMIGAPLLGMPLPLLPLQILWMNLVTDGLPALALGVEPPEPAIMERPPLSRKESFLGRGLAGTILWIGALIAVLCLSCGWFWWRAGDPSWQTGVFTLLTCSQLTLSLAMRSERASLWSLGLFSNRALTASVVVTLLLQLAVIYWGPLQVVFDTKPMPASNLALCMGMSLLVPAAYEVSKALRRS